MIERLVISLIAIAAVLWVVGWLLTHFVLILLFAAGFGGWSWWQSRQRG